MNGDRAARIYVTDCPGAFAYAVIWGGDIMKLEDGAFPQCDRDPEHLLAALVKALTDALDMRATRVEVIAPPPLAGLVEWYLGSGRDGRARGGNGPLRSAWENGYRRRVIDLLSRFEGWEFEFGGELDPTYAELGRLCQRAAERGRGVGP